MGIFSTIGQAIGTFCKTVWNGLVAVWGLIKKVVSTLFSWTVAVMGWLADLATDIVAGIIAGFIVTFIWIFGDDDDLEDEDSEENELGNNIRKKFDKPHKKIVIKGVFDKKKNELLKQTALEATDTISSEVKNQTGRNRFAELEME